MDWRQRKRYWWKRLQRPSARSEKQLPSGCVSCGCRRRSERRRSRRGGGSETGGDAAGAGGGTGGGG
eukprot:4713644-Prymnesium_polylepis.1